MTPLKCKPNWWTSVALLICLMVVLAGCTKAPTKPAHYIFVPDVSASIDPTARRQAFEAIAVFVNRINRGDTLTIIPITGDAAGEAQGQVLRLRVPTNREPYDQDLKRFQAVVRDRLVELEAQAEQKPGDRTDILGTLRLVNEEITTYEKGDVIFVAILSDFIQDSRDLDFDTDSRLSSDTGAQALALQECRSEEYHLRIPVSLGHIRSKDWAKLSRQRRHAIEEFWTTCMSSSGGRAHFVTDGLAAFNGN
jgi:hypothetical protein